MYSDSAHCFYVQLMEQLPRALPGCILGDRGYPLKDWLLTPFVNTDTRPKERYNEAHSITRSTIERCNGVLKKRWYCLKAVLR